MELPEVLWEVCSGFSLHRGEKMDCGHPGLSREAVPSAGKPDNENPDNATLCRCLQNRGGSSRGVSTEVRGSSLTW